MSVRDKIRLAVKSSSLSQNEIARRSGLTSGQLSLSLAGKRKLSLEEGERLLAVLGEVFEGDIQEVTHEWEVFPVVSMHELKVGVENLTEAVGANVDYLPQPPGIKVDLGVRDKPGSTVYLVVQARQGKLGDRVLALRPGGYCFGKMVSVNGELSISVDESISSTTTMVGKVVGEFNLY